MTFPEITFVVLLPLVKRSILILQFSNRLTHLLQDRCFFQLNAFVSSTRPLNFPPDAKGFHQILYGVFLFFERTNGDPPSITILAYLA